MEKVMITGCNGFLGQHIVAAFQKVGYFVVGVDKRPILVAKPDKFIQTDVRDLNVRDLMGIRYVVHLAWRTNIPDCKRHPEESTYDNIDMTVHLVEVAKEAGIKRFVFPSTASLYGHMPTPWSEGMFPLSPIEPYSWQKLSAEYLLRMNSKELNSVIVRFFQVFGEYQREDTALAAFLRLRKQGLPITLTETMAQSKFKSGQRDFVYAGDLARAVVAVAEREDIDSGEIFNIASGTVHTMEEVAEAIGGDVVWIPKREYEVERHEADISKLKAIGWEPEVDVLSWMSSQVS